MTKPRIEMWPVIIYTCKLDGCTNTFKRLSGNDRSKVYCSVKCRTDALTIKGRENMRIVAYMEKTMPATLAKLRDAMHEAIRNDALPLTKKRRSEFWNAKQRAS